MRTPNKESFRYGSFLLIIYVTFSVIFTAISIVRWIIEAIMLSQR